ncbi:MAG: ACT domain-containing protein [Actinobacteria bacterium]|nr:ACT domain-containing protein [Actinomycetota bacterium]
MAKDLTVSIENRPGTLADISEALGNAGINIEGICGFPCEGEGVGHVLVEDAAGARRAIEGAGGKVTAERDVLILEIEDKPGALGERARRIANAGANVDLIYLATRSRVVIGADDLEKARDAAM